MRSQSDSKHRTQSGRTRAEPPIWRRSLSPGEGWLRRSELVDISALRPPRRHIIEPARGAGNNRTMSTTTVFSFLNAA